MEKWDARFYAHAEQVASWSKDPRTKVGCVLVIDNHVVSEGFNGFPAGIEDDARLYDRDIKRAITLHAEINAIIHARGSVRGATAYITTLLPCSQCASALIAAGIRRVVSRRSNDPLHAVYSPELAVGLLDEAGVVVEVWGDE